MSALIEWFVATFILAPLQDAWLGALANAPAKVLNDAAACLATATPALVERAASEPLWAIWTAIGTAIGITTPEAVLRGAAPICGAALDAARPFLG